MPTTVDRDDHVVAALRLLEAGVPMTLLLDLALGPFSQDLLSHEPADLDWLPRARVAV